MTMTIQTLTTLAQTYWGIIAVVLFFGFYSIFHWQNAKKIILGLMFQLEKESVTLAISTGDAKFQFVVDKGYQLLPQGARIFITPAMFESLARSMYDQAKKYITKYMPVTAPTIAPVAPVVVPASIPIPVPVVTPVTVSEPVVDSATVDSQPIINP